MSSSGVADGLSRAVVGGAGRDEPPLGLGELEVASVGPCPPGSIAVVPGANGVKTTLATRWPSGIVQRGVAQLPWSLMAPRLDRNVRGLGCRHAVVFG